MVDRVQIRSISNDEGSKLLRFVRRSTGSVVTGVERRWCCCRLRVCKRQRSPRSRSLRLIVPRDAIHNFNGTPSTR